MSNEPDVNNKLPVMLIGGGGHALSLLSGGFDTEFAGYVDLKRRACMQIPYAGNDKTFLEHFGPDEVSVHIAVVSDKSADMAIRRKLTALYSGFRAATLVSPTAIVTAGSSIGDGTAIMHRVVVNRATIGTHCIINTGAIIEHNTAVGSNTFIGPGCTICGNTIIGENCYIGAGSVIRNGLSIAPGTIIGMGSVVTKSIDKPGVYIGNPAHEM